VATSYVEEIDAMFSDTLQPVAIERNEMQSFSNLTTLDLEFVDLNSNICHLLSSYTTLLRKLSVRDCEGIDFDPFFANCPHLSDLMVAACPSGIDSSEHFSSHKFTTIIIEQCEDFGIEGIKMLETNVHLSSLHRLHLNDVGIQSEDTILSLLEKCTNLDWLELASFERGSILGNLSSKFRTFIVSMNLARVVPLFLKDQDVPVVMLLDDITGMRVI